MSALVLERWENPGGFGDRTSTIAISTTLAFTGAGPINNLLDGAYGQNYTDSVEITGGQSSKEIKFDFDGGSGIKKKITGFVWWKSTTTSHGTWKLAGSNDDITYLDIVPAVSTSFIFAKGVSNGVNDGYYRYYKLIQTSGTTSTTPWNMEIEFRLSDSGSADFRSAIGPSYSNFLGTGDRRAYIEVGGTITWANQTDIINGIVDNSAFWTNGQTGRYVEFDFTEDVLITEITWKQSSIATHGTWKWQGFNGSTWVDLSAAFTLGSSTTQVITGMSAVTDYYQLYRLQQVTGTTSSGPYINEIEFKVGHPSIVSASTPVVSSVSPNRGLFSGGTPVTLSGAFLTGTTDVKFDTTSATSIVVVDAFTITCVTPAHAVGLVDVSIFNPAGDFTLVNGFTYINPAARVTQTPLMVVALGAEELRVTQAPLLILYQPEEPTRVTQAPVLALYIPKAVPLPLPIVPEVQVQESWNWLTVISTARTSREQRSRLRQTPRYKMQIAAVIQDEADRVKIYNLLMRYLKTVFTYPLYHYEAYINAVANIGDTKIYCDTTSSDFRDGEVVALFDPHLEATTFLQGTTIDADGINLSAPLEFQVPPTYQVCPAISFRIAPIVGINMSNIAGDLSLTMESVNPRQFQRPGAAPTLTTIDGILIVPDQPNANNGISEKFDMGNTWFDNDTSIPEVLNEWSNPHPSSERSYIFDRRSKMDYWRAVCDVFKGRQGVGLFPTFRNDIALRDDMILDSVTFTTNNVNLFKWFLETTYRYLAIKTANGMKYRRMINVDPHYDLNGYPDYLTVTLASSTGNTTGDNSIQSISYMNLCRLDTDEVKLTHDSVDTQITFSIKAVNE